MCSALGKNASCRRQGFTGRQPTAAESTMLAGSALRTALRARRTFSLVTRVAVQDEPSAGPRAPPTVVARILSSTPRLSKATLAPVAPAPPVAGTPAPAPAPARAPASPTSPAAPPPTSVRLHTTKATTTVLRPPSIQTPTPIPTSNHHQLQNPNQDEQPLHPTLDLIRERLRSGSQPGARNDDFRLGVVVEGGGMRGVISGAMLMALHDLGIAHTVDVVYGASAGAINATYFLTGQQHGLSIYHEDLTTPGTFIDFRNLFSRSGRPVMNLDFLIDHVMQHVKPLDWECVLSSPVQLKVVASCLDSLRPVLLSDFRCQKDLIECLKASATVPQIAGPPRHVRGRTLVDAAVLEPVPVPTAIADGCTHLLVLCTRLAPAGQSPLMKRVHGTLTAAVKGTVLNAPYMRHVWSDPRATSGVRALDVQLSSALHTCPHEYRQQLGAYVLPVYPHHTAGCHPVCLHKETLLRAIEVGRSSIARAVGPVVGVGQVGAAAAGAGAAIRVVGSRAAGAAVAEGKGSGGGSSSSSSSGGELVGGGFGDMEIYGSGYSHSGMRYQP